MKRRPAASDGCGQGDDDGRELKRPRLPSLPPGSSTFGYYTAQLKVYTSVDDAYGQLGIGIRCTNHSARTFKSKDNLTFLRCRLSGSDPPCMWHAVLEKHTDGSAVLWGNHAAGNAHNAASASHGTRGFQDLSQRQAMMSELESSATITPRAALRKRRLSSAAARDIALPQVQRLKKSFMMTRFSSRRMGDLEATVEKHRGVPVDKHQGYFCVSFVGRGEDNKPKLTLMATTRALQDRWASSTRCTAHIDGGFKFNLLGWPVSALGVSNGAGQFGITGLGLTSSMKAPHVLELLSSFQESSQRVTGLACKKDFGMTDGEAAYRQAMVAAFGSSPLTCWFHVVKAVKQYVQEHAIGGSKAKQDLLKTVLPGLDVLHNARTRPDFETRWTIISEKWRGEGVHEQTAWTDKKGCHHNLIDYFAGFWVKDWPEFYWGVGGGAPLPTTNNQAERYIRELRADAGKVVTGVATTIDFLLKQVEFESSEKYLSDAQRKPTPEQWQKARDFTNLFGTRAIQEVKAKCGQVYVCAGRTTDSVQDRSPITVALASRVAKTMGELMYGAPVSDGQLSEFLEHRVFGRDGGFVFCTCFAFAPTQCCHHALGYKLFKGMVELPEKFDDLPVEQGRRGGTNPRMPGRGSVPLLPDAKDKEITRLRGLLAKVGASAGTGRGSAGRRGEAPAI
jgi:hypothetical protein